MGGVSGRSTFSSGVSVGSLSVTVNGGGGSQTANAARQGVHSALQGLVKQQMVDESKYGGILNPNQGVLKV